MAIILHIDTAVDTASICLAEDGKVLGFEANTVTKEHSSWLHPTINRIYHESGRTMHQTEAIAVTIGPGSYTGLRVGLSAAKGLCFSMGIPLISINTLELIAASAHSSDVDYIVPVIDARRMEVFTASYTKGMEEVDKPHALILDISSFAGLIARGKVLVTGNAAGKTKTLLGEDRLSFRDGMPSAKDMVRMALERYKLRQFSDLTYLEPLYVKDFYQPIH